MTLDLNTAAKLARRHLASTIVVLLVLGGGILGVAAYVWSEFKEVEKQKDALAAERKAFMEEKMTSERMRSEAALVLVEKKAQLDKREFELQQLDSQNKERLSQIEKRASENIAVLNEVQARQAGLSDAARAKEAEDRLQALISQFTSMGIDLNSRAHQCSRGEDLVKYNIARNKLVEIYTVAEAYGLKKKYEHFFFKNSMSISYGCEKAG